MRNRQSTTDRRRAKVFSKPRAVSKKKRLPTHEGVYEMRARMASAAEAEEKREAAETAATAASAAAHNEAAASAEDTAASPVPASSRPRAAPPAAQHSRASAKRKDAARHAAAAAAAAGTGPPGKLQKQGGPSDAAAAESAANKCVAGCGFFGSAQYDGYCSRCYKRHILNDTSEPDAPAAGSSTRRAAVAARKRVARALNGSHGDGAAAAHEPHLGDSDSDDSDLYMGEANGDRAHASRRNLDGRGEEEQEEEDDDDDMVVSTGVAASAAAGAQLIDDEEDEDEDEDDAVAPAPAQGTKRLRVVMRDDGDSNLYRRRLERWRVFLAQQTMNPAVSEFGEGALEVSLEDEAPDALDEWFTDDDFSLPPVAVRAGIHLPGFLSKR